MIYSQSTVCEMLFATVLLSHIWSGSNYIHQDLWWLLYILWLLVSLESNDGWTSSAAEHYLPSFVYNHWTGLEPEGAVTFWLVVVLRNRPRRLVASYTVEIWSCSLRAWIEIYRREIRLWDSAVLRWNGFLNYMQLLKIVGEVKNWHHIIKVHVYI